MVLFLFFRGFVGFVTVPVYLRAHFYCNGNETVRDGKMG